MSESQNEIKPKKRKGLKWLLGISLLLIALFYLLSEFYARKILQPAIEEAFYQATNNEYHLKIGDLSWNVLGRKMELREVEILSNDSKVSENQSFSLSLEQLLLRKIRYRKLLNGKLELDELKLSGLHLEELNWLEDSVNQKNFQRQDAFFQSFYVKEVNVSLDRLLLKNSKNEQHEIDQVKLKMNDFFWSQQNSASLNDSMFFKGFSSSIENYHYQSQQLNTNIHHILISSSHLKNFSFYAQRFFFEDLPTQNTIEFIGPGLQLFALENISNDSSRFVQFDKLVLEQDSVFINQSVKSGFDLEKFGGKIKKEFGRRHLKLAFHQIKLSNRCFHMSQLDFVVGTKGMDLEIDSFKIDDKGPDLTDYKWVIKDAETQLRKSMDSIKTKQIIFKKKAWSFHDFKYLPKDHSFDFQFKTMNADKFDYKAILSDQLLLADQIKLNQPDFTWRGKLSSANKFELPIGIHLRRFIIENGDAVHDPKNISVNRFRLELDSVHYAKNRELHFDSLFSHFNFATVSLKAGQEDDSLFVDLQDLHVDSKKQDLQLSNFKVKLNDSQKLGIIGDDLEIHSFDWKKIYHQNSAIQIDSFCLEELQVNVEDVYQNDSLKTNASRKPEFMIHYLNVPHAEFRYISLQKDSLLTSDVKLCSDSVRIFSEEDYPVLTGPLNLKSGATKYYGSNNALQLSLANWSYKSENNYWDLNQLGFYSKNEEDSLGISSHTEVKIPDLELVGFYPYDFLVQKKIELDTLKLHNPKLRYWGKSPKKLVDSKSFNWKLELRKMVEQYVYFNVQHFNVEDAQLEVRDQSLDRRDELSLENINLKMNRFYLDYQTLEGWDRFFFSDYFKLDFENYFHNINNGDYILDVNNGNLNSETRSLTFNDLSFLSLSDQSAIPANLNLSTFRMSNFYLNTSSAFLPDLIIDDITMEGTELFLKKNKEKQSDKKSNSIANLNIYRSIKKYLNAIELKNLRLDQCLLHLPYEDDQYHFNGVSIGLNDIKIDSSNQVFSDHKFLYADNIRLYIPQFHWFSKDRFYRYEMGGLLFNSSTGTAIVDSLKVISRYDRKTFSANLKYQKDQVDAVVPQIKIHQLDLRELIYRERYSLRKLEFLNPKLYIYKDKTIAADTADYKWMPASQLKNLSFYLNVDTVAVKNGYVQYEEFADLMDRPGKISFNQLNVLFQGLSNDKDFREFGGTLKIQASGLMMSKTPVKMSAVFPLNSKNDEFVSLASAAAFSASDLNSILQPLTLMSVKSGEINQMQMNIKGNNDFATGEMLLKYQDLKIEVLRKNLKESGLASFVANSFVIRRNNKNFLFPRKGGIYFDRVKYRSFVHYLAHFAIIGAKTSIGIDKRKTQKKIDEALEEENK